MKRMLPALLKLLLVLAAVSHGTATFCDITETKTSIQCYVALGQSVFIYPFNTISKIGGLQVFFQTKSFFRYRNKTGPVDDACQNRCQLMTNGTIRLDNLKKNDNGIYIFNEFYKDGRVKQNISVSLTIQDPVSPPVLSQLCLSHGEIRVNCSSTGDDPQYSWALDNRTLDVGMAQTVILRRNVSGSITCTASNRVSSEHTTKELQKCPGPATLSPHTPTNEPAPLPTEEGPVPVSPHTPTNEPAPLPTEEGSATLSPHPPTIEPAPLPTEEEGTSFLWRHILSALVLLAAIGILIEYFISHKRTTDVAGRKRRGSENTGQFVETVC